jgi:hypothetical protein
MPRVEIPGALKDQPESRVKIGSVCQVKYDSGQITYPKNTPSINTYDCLPPIYIEEPSQKARRLKCIISRPAPGAQVIHLTLHALRLTVEMIVIPLFF